MFSTLPECLVTDEFYPGVKQIVKEWEKMRLVIINVRNWQVWKKGDDAHLSRDNLKHFYLPNPSHQSNFSPCNLCTVSYRSYCSLRHVNLYVLLLLLLLLLTRRATADIQKGFLTVYKQHCNFWYCLRPCYTGRPQVLFYLLTYLRAIASARAALKPSVTARSAR